MTEIETKATAPGDINGLFAEFMGAFEEFKRSNDSRLAELEKVQVSGTAGAMTVTAYALSGNDLDPGYFLLDDKGALFAAISAGAARADDDALRLLLDNTFPFAAHGGDCRSDRLSQDSGTMAGRRFSGP